MVERRLYSCSSIALCWNAATTGFKLLQLHAPAHVTGVVWDAMTWCGEVWRGVAWRGACLDAGGESMPCRDRCRGQGQCWETGLESVVTVAENTGVHAFWLRLVAAPARGIMAWQGWLG